MVEKSKWLYYYLIVRCNQFIHQNTIIMGIIKTHDNFKHPEGKIQLLNGNVLECYPLEQAGEKVDNKVKLDTTGTYFAIGKRRLAPTPKTDEENAEGWTLFCKNAFRFLQYRNRIMSNSRMFLCPVPIQSGIAYTGTSGFHRPTLGVYLEWWLNCESALICDENGMKKLVYRIAGSPLSGSNSCGVVDENGKTESANIQPFSTLWSSFMRINSRYDEAKSLYQAYTLKEVVDILEGESLSLIDDMELENIYLRSALYWKAKDLPIKIRNLEDTIDRLKFRLFNAYRDDLKAIMAIYEEKKAKKEKREKEIDEDCKELHRQLKSGEIDNKQYQKRLTPLKKEKENNNYLLREYRRSALEPLFPDLGYDISDVEEFFKDPRSEGPLKSSSGLFF